MNNTTINIRIDKETKLQAMAVAKEIGVDLSTAFHALIRRFIKEKTITFEPLVPNAKTARELKKSITEIKKGNHSPMFTNTTDAIKWLNS